MPFALSPLRRLLVVLALTAAIVSPAYAQIIEVPTFVVVVADDEFLSELDVATGLDSSMVFSWRSRGDGRIRRAFGRTFSSVGGIMGNPFRLDEDNDVSEPHVIADTRGGFLASWRRFNTTGNPLAGRRLGASGTPVAPVFDIVTSGGGFPSYTAAALPSGFVLVSTQGSQVRYRFLDTLAQAVGSNVIVSASGTNSALSPRVAATSDGGFVVAWSQGNEISGRVYDAAGAPLGDAGVLMDSLEFWDLAASPNGGFAVAGARRTDTHAQPSGVWARRFDTVGAPLGPAFVVDLIDPDVFARPQAAYDPAGRLLISWGLTAQTDFEARLYDDAGAPFGAPFKAADEQASQIVLAARPDGRFVHGWRDTLELHANVLALCVPPDHTGCGDGVVQAPCERCDQGPANSDTTPDACRTRCQLASCGDGVTDGSEQCDDGNNVGCDGCDAKCRLEPGFVCGDGVTSTDCGEQCDDGAANDDGTPDACRTACVLPVCGDGVTDSGEGCDDGNRTSCDGCSAVCVPELGLVCGDGIPELHCGEECDDGENAVVGDGCTTPCRLERIPGGGPPFTDCDIEWSIDNPANAPLYDKNGAISGVQTCVDGDSRCDFDGVVGQCTFHLRVCTNNTDVDGCSPGERLQSWELRSPSASKAAKSPEAAAVRDAFLPVLGAIVGTTDRDACSGTLDVPLPLKQGGGRIGKGVLTLKSRATLYTDEKDNDKLKLVCLPNS